jgi:hypothetical protein
MAVFPEQEKRKLREQASQTAEVFSPDFGDAPSGLACLRTFESMPFCGTLAL